MSAANADMLPEPDPTMLRMPLTFNGLADAISRVLARHNINLQLAKITTLGERVEDTFLIDGSALQQNRMQLQIESEMLDAIA